MGPAQGTRSGGSGSPHERWRCTPLSAWPWPGLPTVREALDKRVAGQVRQRRAPPCGGVVPGASRGHAPLALEHVDLAQINSYAESAAILQLTHRQNLRTVSWA